MYDLTKFTLRDMTECGTALRQFNQGAKSMEEVANKIVSYLHDNFIAPQTGEKSCALVRFFKTHPYEGLSSELREFACGMLGSHSASPGMKCLTLLATAGEKPEWNSRYTSSGHKAIPLYSEKLILQSPMIFQLVQQFGLDIGQVLNPEPHLLVDMEQSTFNVFHVPEAIASPFIPTQEEFVIPFSIQSVVGFGGLLPSGDLFAIIIFSKVAISRNTAEMFKILALSAKMALLPFGQEAVFTPIK